MTYLFFDTETTGLPKNWKAPVTDTKNWPRMVQIAWLIYDNSGKQLSSRDYIIKPENFTIPADVVKIHGISTERALKEGHPLNDVLTEFISDVEKADFLVGHNVDFDDKIVGAELVRLAYNSSFHKKQRICTMASSTKFCAIPGNYGYKWPSLSELYFKLFREKFEDAHQALIDIQATAKCFWELKRLKVLH
jgi:DNA polymerase III subunit epsilon